MHAEKLRGCLDSRLPLAGSVFGLRAIKVRTAWTYPKQFAPECVCNLPIPETVCCGVTHVRITLPAHAVVDTIGWNVAY